MPSVGQPAMPLRRLSLAPGEFLWLAFAPLGRQVCGVQRLPGRQDALIVGDFNAAATVPATDPPGAAAIPSASVQRLLEGVSVLSPDWGPAHL